MRISREKGTSLDYEAALPGRSQRSIMRRMSRLYVGGERIVKPRRSATQATELNLQAMQMKQQGFTTEQIAGSLGIGLRWAHRIIRKGRRAIIDATSAESIPQEEHELPTKELPDTSSSSPTTLVDNPSDKPQS